MWNFFTKLFEQQYWIIIIFFGVILVIISTVSVDKNYLWTTHPPNTFILVGVGIALILLSCIIFLLNYFRNDGSNAGGDFNQEHVREGKNGALWTVVGECEIWVINGQIENQPQVTGSAIALPCNEYFDDECAYDPRSALGAYVNSVFKGEVDAFISLSKEQCEKKLGPGTEQQKTDEVRAESFGAGRSVLLIKPLGNSVPVALVSTTTQRAGEGLAGQISYLFDGMRGLVKCLADARLNEVVMPILGGGHSGISPSLALVGLLLAVAESARYGYGRQRLKKVTIVVFRQDEGSPAEVDPMLVRRALALIGS